MAKIGETLTLGFAFIFLSMLGAAVCVRYKPSKEYWGWVLEMWAFTIACSQQDPPIEFELHPEFMLQVPWDKTPQINVCEGSKCEMKDGYAAHFHSHSGNAQHTHSLSLFLSPRFR